MAGVKRGRAPLAAQFLLTDRIRKGDGCVRFRPDRKELEPSLFRHQRLRQSARARIVMKWV
jgi:hypothetical protein